MKLLYLFLILSCVLISGCASASTELQDKALAFAANDKKIDEKEYNALIEVINTSNDDGLNRIFKTDQKIDHTKVVNYLVKLFKAKNLSLTAADIWTPAQQVSKSYEKFNIDVYIENSASMDGYVKGVTEFETAIYNLLGDLKISDLTDSLNLNYINKKVTYTKPNAVAPDIQDFIEKLEPSDFKQRGGDRSVSDLKNILQTVIEKVDDKNLGILISDFVFSPGSNLNAQDYLNNQSVGIKIDFAEKLKKFDLSAIVIQLQSNFDGIYYDKSNTPIPLKGKRPYYIWIFGNSSQIQSILSKGMLDNIKGGYQNRIIFIPLKEPVPLKYKILLRPRIGEFELPEGAQGPLTNASVSQENLNKGTFQFSIAVNFSESLQDSKYFLDSNNYRISNPNYSLSVEPVDQSDEVLKEFTHKITLKTNEIRNEALRIDVIGKTPTWVTNSTSEDDSRIAIDESEKQKTFGLKHLIEGVSEAFYPQSSANAIKTISISINK